MNGAKSRGRRQQSAMEYLMTYGWSILIIAIVLAALFSLGVFSNSNLGPRAQPNSCRVYRPNGPGTTTNINLEGVCNGELPQYVAQLNGVSSYIPVGDTYFPIGSSARSVFAWVYLVGPPYPTNPNAYPIFSYGTFTNNEFSSLIFTNAANNPLYFWGRSDDYYTASFAPSVGQWYFVGYTYASGATQVTLYMNGQSSTGTLTGSAALNTVLPGSDPSDIGKASNGNAYYFNGLISNVQIYSAALDANAVQSLYLEGISGAPVEPQNLVGWWPLDGDTNDYSGNGNNGAATNVIFTSSWASGYTPP